MSRDYLLGLATIPAVAVVALTGRLMWEYVLGPCMYICGCHQIDEAGTPPLPIGELEDHQ
jgi:hypothetical protein